MTSECYPIFGRGVRRLGVAAGGLPTFLARALAPLRSISTLPATYNRNSSRAAAVIDIRVPPYRHFMSKALRSSSVRKMLTLTRLASFACGIIERYDKVNPKSMLTKFAG